MPLPSHLLEKHVPQGLNLLHCLGDYKASDLHSLLAFHQASFVLFLLFQGIHGRHHLGLSCISWRVFYSLIKSHSVMVVL